MRDPSIYILWVKRAPVIHRLPEVECGNSRIAALVAALPFLLGRSSLWGLTSFQDMYIYVSNAYLYLLYTCKFVCADAFVRETDQTSYGRYNPTTHVKT